MARTLAGIAVGIAIGFGLGWLVFHDARPAPAASAPVAAGQAEPARTASTAVAPTAGPLRPVALREAADPPAPREPPLASSSMAELTAQNAALLAELQRVQAQVARERADRAADVGEPLKPPANLDDRFKSDALLANLNAALKAAGFANAQVTSIDCSEYPCIAYGEGLSGPKDFDKLESASGWAYAGDRVSSGSWGDRPGPDGAQRSHFAITPWPRDDQTSGAEMGKRLRYRYQQMAQTWSSPPAK